MSDSKETPPSKEPVFNERHHYNCTGTDVASRLATLRQLATAYCAPQIVYSIIEGSNERSHCKISIVSCNGYRVDSQWHQCYCQAWFQHESAILYRTVTQQEKLISKLISSDLK